MTYIMFIFLTYNEIPIPKRRICRTDRCRVLCAAARTGRDGAPPLPSKTPLTLPSTWPLPRQKCRIWV